jgi:hypothetical protein
MAEKPSPRSSHVQKVKSSGLLSGHTSNLLWRLGRVLSTRQSPFWAHTDLFQSVARDGFSKSSVPQIIERLCWIASEKWRGRSRKSENWRPQRHRIRPLYRIRPIFSEPIIKGSQSIFWDHRHSSHSFDVRRWFGWSKVRRPSIYRDLFNDTEIDFWSFRLRQPPMTFHHHRPANGLLKYLFRPMSCAKSAVANVRNWQDRPYMKERFTADGESRQNLNDTVKFSLLNHVMFIFGWQSG